MTRQCIGCGTILDTVGRSPRCARCKDEHDRARNLQNVRAHRGRNARANYPTNEEIVWLNGLNLGLADPVVKMLELIEAGRAETGPEVLSAARVALDRYLEFQWEFDHAIQDDSVAVATSWRGFYEYLQEELK